MGATPKWDWGKGMGQMVESLSDAEAERMAKLAPFWGTPARGAEEAFVRELMEGIKEIDARRGELVKTAGGVVMHREVNVLLVYPKWLLGESRPRRA